MDIPGAAGGTQDWDKAQEDADRLLEELKKEVKADLKDIGVLRKEMHVTVPAKVIADHMEHNYAELMTDAQVPGFRKGRAPRRLIEKRFGSDVRESLVTSIVGQSFYAATENNELDVLGDPLFRIESDGGVKLVDIGEALEQLKLPEEGDFSYTCELELKPDFELPDLKGIEIKAPDIKVTDEMIDEQILRQRKMRGHLQPVEEPAGADDQVTVDWVLNVDGQEIKREESVPLGVRGTWLDGIELSDLGEQLKGVKTGDTVTAAGTVPDDYERADLRGKSATFAFKVHEVKRLVPQPLDEFREAWGFESEQELREDVAAQMESERDQMLERAKRGQVEDYLLEHTKLELPEKFSSRQTERAVMREVIDLQQRGMPVSEIEAHIDEMRTSAKERVATELRLGFILDKVADELGVHVTDEEVNTEIARIARLYNRRFDRVRDDLQGRGLLNQLVEQIRQNKCIAQLLEDAKFVDAAADEKDDDDAGKKKTKKKTTKKTEKGSE